MTGTEGLMQSFNGWPMEFPTFAALDHSESPLTGLPSSSRTLLKLIYFLTVSQAHPDTPALMSAWTPEITVPQRNPATTEGPPAIPTRTIGPIKS